VARPRKADKKVPVSFRANPELASRLEQYATALGTTTSEAIERALETFLQSELAHTAIADQEATRAAASEALRADADAIAAARRISRDSLALLREHIAGATYREMSDPTELTATEVRMIVKQVRSDLGEHFKVLVARPQLLDGLLGKRREHPSGGPGR
jgi:predicted transcriptional regulator